MPELSLRTDAELELVSETVDLSNNNETPPGGGGDPTLPHSLRGFCMRIFLTGGMGFIGSHTAVVLLEAGHDVTLYDNLSNADADVVDRIEVITGKRPTFIEGDIRDGVLLEKALKESGAEVVIHFAGLKAVGESVEKPLEYYDNNIVGTVRLMQAMRNAGVSRLIFSSSSTVYGTPAKLPLTEDCPTGEATNPYGRTKLHIEQILADCAKADPSLSVVCLRYFNPIGAHPSGLIGEDPNGIPNNLLPYVARVANGRLPELAVFGSDYDTPDGTGVRDYIHVMDLAEGHAKAIPYAVAHTGWIAVNLGCGRGYSVLEVIRAFEKASGRRVPYRLAERRPGDIAANWCDPTLAKELFGWEAKYDIDAMCRDSWRFESMRAAQKQRAD